MGAKTVIRDSDGGYRQQHNRYLNKYSIGTRFRTNMREIDSFEDYYKW